MAYLDVMPPEFEQEDSARLLRVARELAAARELERIMEATRRAARDLTRADGVTFVLREGDFVHYADEEAISPLWKGCRFPARACISGWAMLHRQTVAIEDIYVDARIPHDAYRPTFVKSLVMVPVGAGEPVAAIGAYWARPHVATARERELLEALAGFAALALANEALVRELREAVRSREEFIALAAHELRTPLTALGLTLQGAQRAIELGRAGELERLRAAIVRGERHAARLGKLVDSLLDVSRAERPLPLEREPVELSGLAAAVVERLRDRSAGPITFRSEGPVEGFWDRARVEQIIESLVGNAVKFGGEKPILVEVGLEDGQARLVVEDGGIGIPPEDRERIFGKFERAASPRSFGGLGLGLWIVQQNVAAHGGAVEVDGRPGGGARFRVLLPTASAPNVTALHPAKAPAPDVAPADPVGAVEPGR